ncbi:MAG: hypothetical protein ACJA0Q_000964 [Saprospiraceae bacterium]|jgi:hypothetical protein
MKPLFSLFLALSFSFSVYSKQHDWIQYTSSTSFKSDSITPFSWTENTFDNQCRKIESTSFFAGPLIKHERDFVYNGRTASFFVDSYSSGQLDYTKKHEVSYSDSNWIQTTLEIIIDMISNQEESRIEYQYDSQGRQIEKKKFYYGALVEHSTNYNYVGRSATYDYNSYALDGILNYSVTNNVTYCDLNWIQKSLDIEYEPDGINENRRTEVTYDSQGRKTNQKFYTDGSLTMEERNFIYDGHIADFTHDTYFLGTLNQINKGRIIYKNNGNLSFEKKKEVLITAHPNPTLGQFKITSSNLLKTISIYNQLGQELLIIAVNGYSASIDLTGHNKGVYIAQVEQSHKMETVKILLSK